MRQRNRSVSSGNYSSWREKRIFKSWEHYRRSTGVPQGEERENGAEKLFETIVTENFSKIRQETKIVPFSSCLQSFPVSGSFPMSQFFVSDCQSIGVSASASVLPMNIQDWFPLGWTGLISLQSKGLSSLLQHHSSKASILWCSAFLTVQLSYPYVTTGKTMALTIQTFVGNVMFLLFNMLSRLIITFLPRSKCLLISMAAVTICTDIGAPQNSLSLFPFFPIYLPWSDGTGCHDLSCLNAEH